MKQGKECLQPGNLVTNSKSPRSEYHTSHTTSPNSRSFVSDNPDEGMMLGMIAKNWLELLKIE